MRDWQTSRLESARAVLTGLERNREYFFATTRSFSIFIYKKYIRGRRGKVRERERKMESESGRGRAREREGEGER